MNDDLISRSALLDALKTEEWAAILGNSLVRYLKAKTLIEKIPAVDAEEVFKHLHWVKEALEMAKQTVAPVVRCRDCVNWKKATVSKEGFLICPQSGMKIMARNYCSYGERAADDATD